MPTITTAQEAIDVEDKLLSRYYTVKRLSTARREDGTWVVIFNVGVIFPEKVLIKVDADTGSILEFNDPANQ